MMPEISVLAPTPSFADEPRAVGLVGIVMPGALKSVVGELIEPVTRSMFNKRHPKMCPRGVS